MSPRFALPSLLVALAVVGPAAAAERPLVERAQDVDTKCIELEKRGHSELAAGRPGRAGELFERLIACRLESPLVSGEAAGTGALTGEMATFVNRLEVLLYHRAVALKAFAVWTGGDRKAAERALDWTRRDGEIRSDLTAEQQQRRRRLILSEQIAAHAAERFDAGRWREAADAYAEARAHRLRANSERDDEESARQRYNQAMAEYRDGRNRRARELLLELRRRMPDYRRGAVEQALGNIPASR